MRLHTGVYGHRKRVCTESGLWEKNPLPHWEIESALAMCRSDALTNWATSPPWMLRLYARPLCRHISISYQLTVTTWYQGQGCICHAWQSLFILHLFVHLSHRHQHQHNLQVSNKVSFTCLLCLEPLGESCTCSCTCDIDINISTTSRWVTRSVLPVCLVWNPLVNPAPVT